MTSPPNEQQRVVGWFCDRDGKTVLTSGFVAENRAYVEAHKDCNWRPLLHPDAVAELIEEAENALDGLELSGLSFAATRLRAALANVGAQP